jgi:hypothetical protein
MRYSPLPLVFGTLMTTMGLAMGCFVAQVTTLHCWRDRSNQPGVCRLDQSTVFLPWKTTGISIQLEDVQKAELIDEGGEDYRLVLRSRNKIADRSIFKSEYSEPSQTFANGINSFLETPSKTGFTARQGGTPEEIGALVGFCGFGLLFSRIKM